MRLLEYNSQRDNYDFEGQFKGSCQCFSTSVWMFLAYYVPDIIAHDDNGLAKYVDDVSNIVGKPGIGEQVKSEHPEITGNTAYWWQVHKAAIEKIFSDHLGHCPQKVAFREQVTIDELKNALENGPVILGTRKLGGLPGGHIILAVDKDAGNIYCNDPYGDATKGYASRNGENVKYPIDWLSHHIGAAMWAE